MSQETWHIGLLGGLQVHHGERLIQRFSTRRAASLLARLGFAPERAHPREELIALLWPESDPEDARNGLRQALHLLRRQLRPDEDGVSPLLHSDKAHVWLNSALVSTDLQQFILHQKAGDAARTPEARREHLQQAADLYRGELLTGLYDEWIFPERQHLEHRYLHLLHRLVTEMESAGETLRAATYALRIVALDPWREEAHCQVMRLYAAAGQPQQALRHYLELERMLREEFHAEPHPETLLCARECVGKEFDSPPRSGASVRGALFFSPPVSESPAPESPETASAPHLPAPINRFFGREEEIALLAEALGAGLGTSNGGSLPPTPDGQRLITLTGPAGSGKTRLALEVARRAAPTFGGAVWFVPLAALPDARLIPDAIADALNLSRETHLPLDEQIVRYLLPIRALLVLDNFETVAEEGAEAVLALLQSIPSLTCLVTSRHRLNIEGEREFPVPPLPVPSPTAGRKRAPKAETLLAYLETFAAVRLFLDRARAARPGFRATPQNAAELAAVCVQLEGLPLAIELAAPRIRALSLSQMREQLARRLEFLTSRRKDLPARHRSLRAAIEWSVRLLTPEQQRFFRGLAVFHDGCLREAVHAVCRSPLASPSEWKSWYEAGMAFPEGAETEETLRLLEELLERSLLYAEETQYGLRFRMLESLRDYARSQWTSEEEANLPLRHACYACCLVRRSAENHGRVWIPFVLAELENVRAGMEWMIAYAPEDALKMAGELTHALYYDSEIAEALYWMERALDAVTDTIVDYNVRIFANQRAFDISGDEKYAREMERLSQGRQNESFLTILNLNQGSIHWDRGNLDQAYAYYEEALKHARQIVAEFVAGKRAGWRLESALWEEDDYVVHALEKLGMLAWRQGRFEEAERHLQESLSICAERHPDPENEKRCFDCIGMVMLAKGEDARAVEIYRQDKKLSRIAWGLVTRTCRLKLGVSLCLAGGTATQQEEGEAEIQQGLLAFLEDEQQDDNFGDGYYLIPAFLAEARGDHDLTARLLGRAETALRLFGVNDALGFRVRRDACEESSRRALGEAAYTDAFHAGEALSWQEAFTLVLNRLTTALHLFLFFGFPSAHCLCNDFITVSLYNQV